MTTLVFLSFFMIGTILGSFYYVVAYRIPKGESIISPPSHCPNCNHRLTPLELIPIFSYLLQGGKCKNCKQKISIFYPLFEITVGLLFGISYLSYNLVPELIIVLTFVSLIVIITLSDYYYMIISDGVLIFFALAIFIEMFIIHGWYYAIMHIIYGIISFIIMYLLKLFGDCLFKKESMGGGDIKLLFVFGLMFGWQMSIISIFLSAIIGLPISLILLHKNEEHVLPFGPYLGMASLIIVLTQIDINTVMNLIVR
ncbi:MAG: prepilin peptidase [Bacilli bacterium]|nr:prepilin peptidase [Bacilli bacterium]